jgi:iron complex outermembrane receptor protein|tara:strand:+ start:1750 stop:3900 length:2151 start_codon:yes stop_codon:yes gene_type:complete
MNYKHRLTSAIFTVIATSIPSLSFAAAQLEEVVVTAERREASVQDVPVAVSAYDRVMMENLQLNDSLDLINVVPNLFGGNNTGLGTANMYYLRAQGNDESIATFDPPVGTYVDDVYITRQNANNFSLFDVERIEVLRGPQGTLYGRNTTGGAISVVMRKPGEEMGGYLEAGAGSFGRTQLRAGIDMPLSDTVLTKFSAFKVEDDGYLKNSIDGKDYNATDQQGIRGALRFLSDGVTWDLSVDYAEIEASNIHGALDGDDRVSASRLSGGLPAPYQQKSSLYGNKVETLNLTSNISIDVGGGTASIIVGQRNLDQEFMINFPNALSDDFFAIDNVSEHNMFSAEVKWSGNVMNDRMYISTGLYMMDEDNKTDFTDYLDYGVLLGMPTMAFFIPLADRILTNTTESAAVYLQADIKVSENGTLTVGGRYTNEEKEVGFSGSITTEDLIAANVPILQDESKFTPRIAYAHTFSENVMGYASATNGFKSGGWNARATSGIAAQPFGPEEIWSYEAGIRADLMDGRLRTNITAFYSDVEDLQTTSATPSGQFLTTNAGGMEVTGFEAEITALLTDTWQVYGVVGLQDAKYIDLPDGCVAPNTSYAAYDSDCNAAEPKRSPDETFTLGTNVTFDMNGMELKPYGLVRYIGPNYVGTINGGKNTSSTIVNAGISFAPSNDAWSLNVECKNCTDEKYFTSNLFLGYYNMPRTYMASIEYKFGAR